MALSRTVATISAEAALTAVQAAQAEARRRDIGVVAAVVDAAGHLLACLRGDDAFIASVEVARDKAWTAAVFKASTAGLGKALSENPILLDGIAAREHVVLFAGGFPLREQGAVIGGIGVSGGTEEEDCACAEAGLRALGLAP
jgi:uncharacterized protein GlcG (DUF336 family)